MNRVEKALDCLNNLKGVKKLLFLSFGALVFALPFMAENLWIFGWLGLSFLFVSVFDFKKTLKRVFGSLFCFFFMFYVFCYSWFVSMYPFDFVGLGPAESVGVILCAEVLIPLIHSTIMSLCTFVGFIAAKKTENLYFKSVLVSFGYVLGELMQSVGTLAFPWAMLFVGQTDRIEILQSANLFGARFITLIMVFVNALIAFALMNAGKNRKQSKALACIALAIFVLNFGYGAVRMGLTDYDKTEKITAVALQGNIPSSEKWRADTRPATEIYYELTKKTADYCKENGIDVDVAAIPETAFPFKIYPEDPKSTSARKCFEMAQLLDADMFIGAFSGDGEDTYNSIFVFTPDGRASNDPYDKRSLVPFGEFLPYRDVFKVLIPSLSEMNMLSSDLSKGTDTTPLETTKGHAACLVCFDSIFPENARLQVNKGAEYIVISTNDSWYKESRALYQHASHARMRAIENNVPVLRSGNTGISMIIDPVGRVNAQTNVNERTFIVSQMPLPRSKTLYTYIGDLVAPIGLILVFGVILYSVFKKKILPR